MKRMLAAAALAVAAAAPMSVLTATTAGAAPAIASSGSASGSADLLPQMPPNCVGNYDPLLFAFQWYVTGTYPRSCGIGG